MRREPALQTHPITGPKILVLSCCALGLALASLRAQEHQEDHGADSGPPPAIDIPEPNHDFGEVWIGQELEHTFEVNNKGQGPLTLLKVRPSCGCTVAQNDSLIPPGGSGKIRAGMRTAKLASGPFDKTITVSSNDANNARLTLHLIGSIKYYVEINPRSAQFGDLRPGIAQTQVIHLTNQSDKPLELALTDSRIGEFFAAELSATSPGQEYNLTIRSQPPYRAGRARATVKLLTNMPGQAEIQIAVSANAMDRLQAEPQSITLLRASPTESKKKITLINHGDQPVHLLGASCDDARVGVDTLELEAGRKYEVTLTLAAGYQPPSPGATLRLQTDDAEKPVVEIPVRGTPRPPTPAEMLTGQPVPAVEFDTAGGAHLNTKEPDGPVVLVFYASWCPHSKRTLPLLERARKMQEERGVRFTAVNMDQRPGPTPPANPREGPLLLSREQSLEALRKLDIGMDVSFDDEQEFGKTLFKVTSFPTLVIIRRDGRIAKVHVGVLAEQRSDSSRGAWSAEDLEELLDRLREE